jgi:hypothetical protein
MEISIFEMSETNNKRLKTDLLLIINKLTKTTIVEIYAIGFSHTLCFMRKKPAAHSSTFGFFPTRIAQTKKPKEYEFFLRF